jgi:transcriptional regulator with XRE-family HTH domain
MAEAPDVVDTEQLVFESLLKTWEQALPDLPMQVRSKWRKGRWTTVLDGTAYFEVPNDWHQRACQEGIDEVEAKLWIHGSPEMGELKVKVIVEEPPDDDSYVLAAGELDDADGSEDVVKAALGKTILAARKRAGLSQREIGERAGTDQTVISSWERGIAAPSIDRMFRVDLALGLQPGTLLVRAGLIRPGAVAAAAKRSQGEPIADVTSVRVASASGTTGMTLPPRLTVEQWLELVRTMVKDDEQANKVLKILVTSSSDDADSSIEMPAGYNSLEELLRLVEIMLEAQGPYVEPRGWGSRPPTYDPAEEPF